jgi:hypothetical protein
MVPDITSIIARKYGMNKNILLCRNKVMEQMRHSVRTAHGDSNESYKKEHLNIPLLGGITQGKADVASVWNLESQTLLRAHREHVQGVLLPHVADPDSAIDKNNDAFVDDTNNVNAITGSDFRECERLVIDKTEDSAQTWSELIESSGGLLPTINVTVKVPHSPTHFHPCLNPRSSMVKSIFTIAKAYPPPSQWCRAPAPSKASDVD